MKIKLAENIVVEAYVDELGCLGCHLIACEKAPTHLCEEGQCILEDRGLGGEYYPIEEIKDLIVEGDA